LIWELEFQEKEFSLQAREAKGLPEPEWAKEEPDIGTGDDFYLSAFYELSTCRRYGNVIGPIPWNRIVQYGDRKQLDEEVCDAFVYIIREMDSSYISWYSKQEKKHYDRLQYSGKNRPPKSGSKRKAGRKLFR
jgi:hypothetical protein